MGTVILVGAGPGDSGLLTLRGQQAIQQAEVVLYDRLVGSGILAMIPPTAMMIDVGKNAGEHPVPQQEINRLILDYAMQGKQVVRLKGGDPYLFGRGAEELEELVNQGIPFEVVPGITSAIAVPAYAGIPVTHRNYSSSLHIVTAYSKQGEKILIDFESLVKIGGTLVFLMGVRVLADIVEELLKAGKDENTPTALVENGTTAHQRKVVGTLSTILKQAQEEKIVPPSILVVGEVAALSDRYDWFGRKLLHGVSVLVTRPKQSTSRLSIALRKHGCEVFEYPCIYTEPIPMNIDLLKRLPSYNWFIFTSAIGVHTFIQALQTHKRDIRSIGMAKIAAVGNETASTLMHYGIVVHYIPKIFDGEHLANGLLPHLKTGEQILLYRSELGGKLLPKILRDAGMIVDDVAAYHTHYYNSNAFELQSKLEKKQINFVTFTSASTVIGFAKSMPDLDYSSICAICIGRQTAQKAEEYGFHTIVSDETSIDSMVKAIIQLTGTSKESGTWTI